MKNLNSSLNLITGILLITLIAMFAAALTGVPLFYALPVLLCLSAIPRAKGVAYQTVSPDISQISNYIGKVRAGLFGKLYNMLDIANDITLVPNVKNKLQLTKLLIKNGPEPYSGIFEPAGDDIGYSGQVLEVDQFQRDLILDPRRYRTTYLSDFRPSGEGTLNNRIPFPEYTYGQVLKQLAASLNDQTAFFGLGAAAFAAYNGASTYSAGARIKFTVGTKSKYFIAAASTTAGQSPATNPEKWTDANALAVTVGLGTRIKTARDASVIPASNVISTGDMTSTSGVYAQSKKVFRGLSDAIKAQGANLYMPVSIWELLADDFEDKVGKFTENDNSGIIYLANTNKKCRIVPTTWQRGSKMLIATQKENLLMGTDLLSDLNEVNVIPDVYTLKMGIAGVLGFNFQDPEAIVINDQN